MRKIDGYKKEFKRHKMGTLKEERAKDRIQSHEKDDYT